MLLKNYTDHMLSKESHTHGSGKKKGICDNKTNNDPLFYHI